MYIKRQHERKPANRKRYSDDSDISVIRYVLNNDYYVQENKKKYRGFSKEMRTIREN